MTISIGRTKPELLARIMDLEGRLSIAIVMQGALIATEHGLTPLGKAIKDLGEENARLRAAIAAAGGNKT